ncbi:MAG: murein biosynthesis integral membrane protein MurJ [Acidobacteria bacterium]|nr:murein biosynthesis integral membrane protein MurJ [Acidobacteriota bacterium]
MSIRKDMAGASLVVILWSGLSKICGLIRDAMVAFFLGTSGAADAVYLAFQLPNLFRRFYGDGAFSSVLVPALSQIPDRDRKNAFLSRVFLIMGTAGAVAAFLAVFFAKPIVSIFFPGVIRDAATLATVAALLRLMSAYLFFASLAMVCKGMFESAKIFSVSAATSLLFNLTVIIFLLFFRNAFTNPAHAFAVGVAAGGAIQFLTHLLFLKQVSFRFSWKKSRETAAGPLFRRAVPVMLATGVFQLNMLVGRSAASFLGTGQVSSLDYASRIIEIVMGLAVLPVASTLLPHISPLAASGDKNGSAKLTGFSMKLVIIATVPATVGLYLLAQPISALLFQRGKFGAHSTLLTADALGYFALGLLFLGLFRVLAQVCFSFHDTALPFRAAALAFTVNLVFCIVLAGPMKNGGIALSATIASLAGAGVLIAGIRRHLKLAVKSLAATLAKTGIAAALMAGGILYLSGRINGKFTVLLLIGAGIGIYSLALSLLMMGEWKEMKTAIKGGQTP